MAFLQWSNSYALNLKDVDEQHEKLFELVNTLYDSGVNGDEQNSLGIILDELIDYTVYHFETEEKLFIKHAYPKYNQHKEQHDDLTKQVLTLQEQFRAKKVTIAFDVLDFLSDWLKKHTMESDLEFAVFLKDRIYPNAQL